MMIAVRRLALCVFWLLLSSAAYATDGTLQAKLLLSLPGDACTMYRYSTITNQWNVSSCKSPTGCRTCDNINRCRTVYLNASCTCTDTPVPNSPGITTCTGMTGSCLN